MANNDNIIYAKFNHGREITTDSRSQYAYGQVLKISGLHLPASFDADVSNKGDKQAKAIIGTDNELPIDDAFFLSGKDVIVMINVHAADKDGRTKYIIRIPVEKRPERADIELEPVEQDVVSTAIATLNEAIEQTSASAESAENSANRAQQSATDAETSATSASNSEVLAQQYMERAETAAENAGQSETKAKTSEDNAKASEEHAEQIVTEIEQYTERAETASTNAESSASIATQKATEAFNNANIATTKANEASTSATNAQQSATDAQESANSASASASRALVNAEKTQSDKEIVELTKTNVLSAASEAQTYATTAQSASQAIQNMNVQATTLESDFDATVEKSVNSTTGAVTLTYGIPKGVKGEKGDTGSKGDKGDPFVYSDFTSEQLASLKGEKGDKGDTGTSGKDGADGKDGINGTDGISPTVTITSITGGNRITITDVNGQHSADVMDGDDYTLTQQDKADIAGLVNIPVDDVQIENNSIVDNGIVNIPIASTSQAGVAHININNGIGIQNGYLFLCDATSGTIKMGSHQFRAIVPLRQHESVFYGLAKASGDTTQSQSDNAIGIYTDSAKTAIQTMLDVPSKSDIPNVNVDDVQIDGTSIIDNGVANIPKATNSVFGTTRAQTNYGTQIFSNGALGIYPASSNVVKSGIHQYIPITPERQHESTFYGLAKASGDTTQSASDNTVGTYTDGAKSAIQTMLGVPSVDDVVTDVQVNGTSVTTNGIANIPIANGQDTLGLTQYNSTYGVTVNANGRVQVFPAISSEIKGGTNDRRPITPSVQHESIFYGLAKAAGDTTQSSSSNAVGMYTSEAQTAIKQMLDVKDDYDSLVVEVSGTDPVITGKASYRYNCGELYTLSITPPESGTMDIIFTSGTTPTVLTLPNTVKMPTWWAGIETNTTYEMCITDGTYCGVMSWAT